MPDIDNPFYDRQPGPEIREKLNHMYASYLSRLDDMRGWSPILSVTQDGDRDVLEVVDWIDGVGTKPAQLGYIGLSGIVSDISEAENIRGLKGDPGPKGDQGDPGLKGDQGDPGLKGDQGDPGLKGDQGDPGLKGDQGDPGLKGDQGDPGLKGDQGDPGPKGDQGDPGPKGDQGDQGDQGERGNDGPANELTIGTVESGANASATITGDSPSQVLNLVLPKGDQGDQGNDGPANELTIGTVESGANASATLTGDSPSQVLNLVLPKGGDGWTPVIAVETDAERVVLKLEAWTGGTGTSPGTGYIGTGGVVPDIASALDIRGAPGESGSGTVNGPTSSVVGELAAFGDTEGKLIVSVEPAADGKLYGRKNMSWVDVESIAKLISIDNKTSSYTVISSDNGKVLNCSGGPFVVNLPEAETLEVGFNFWVWNTGSTPSATITIVPSGAELVDSEATLSLQRSNGVQVLNTGTGWVTGAQRASQSYADNPDSAGKRPVASEPGAVAIGESKASGTGSFSVNIGDSTSAYGASGANALAVGILHRASSLYTACLGGGYSVAAVTGSLTVGGLYSFANGFCASTLGGYANIAQGNYSVAMGMRALADQHGKLAHSSGIFAAPGDAQRGVYVLKRQTTDATGAYLQGSTELDYSILLGTNSLISFEATIIALSSTVANTSKAFKVTGVVRRGTAEATIVGSPSVQVLASEGSVGSWTVTATTTYGALYLNVVGSSGNTINWVASVHTVETFY